MCKGCEVKSTWWWEENSSLECGFKDGEFNSDNWNCGLLDYIRDEAEDGAYYHDDVKYAIISNYDYVLLVSWYKSRGCTDRIELLNGEGVVTEDMIEEIVYDIIMGKSNQTEEDTLLLNKIKDGVQDRKSHKQDV